MAVVCALQSIKNHSARFAQEVLQRFPYFYYAIFRIPTTRRRAAGTIARFFDDGRPHMALLQISEPGLAPDPHQERAPGRVAVGIDLGTTHSLVAAVREDGTPHCLPDAHGRVLLPSVVRCLPQGRSAVGHAAQAYLAQDAANTIASAKRWMGRALADLPAAHALPYRFVALPGQESLAVQTVDGPKTPVEVSARILEALRQRAEQHLGAPLDGAVITVPAYFDDAQRQATKDAARLAGILLLRLINEPTAAAIAYGLEHAAEGVYAVYDLGGGTFDISILRLTRGVFEVIATGGDSALGGDDWDAALADWLARQCAVAPESARDRARWLLAARECKHALGGAPVAPFRAELSAGVVACSVQRAEFERITAHLLHRTLAAARRALHDAGLAADAVQGVVLVGGATRMPQIREAVAQLFGRQPLLDLNPDEVVALGAALQAGQLVGASAHDVLLLDVTPLSLGVETMGGLVERIIERNEPIPAARAQEFTTYQDGQTALAIHVVQGERELAADCRSLARFELRGIPPMSAGAARIRVSFTVDADGLLSVSAQEQTSGVQAHVDVKPAYGLTDEAVTRMLQESFAAAEGDAQARALAQARVDGSRLLLATQSALDADGDLLDAAQRRAIEEPMQALRALLDKTHSSAAEIEAASKALARSTEAFAAERMNRSIRRALSGQHVQSL